MNKFKKGFLFLSALFAAGILKAQSIDDGKKMMYYEKYISAKNIFQQLVNANPNNTDAVYWLGQAMILPDENKDIPGTKALYQKTLTANSNSALLIAGMGHIELLEGKQQDARNRFETAISLSQGKSIPVFNAIGAAIVNVKDADPAYAIDKLKTATTLKGFKDPETWCLLGDAYRKIQDGGNAQKAYEAALAIDPKYARAKYRLGKIYITQGKEQEGVYMPYFNDAIALDAQYAPVYYELHQYYYNTDVGKSADYLQKYLSVKGTVDEPNGCYYAASMKFAQGLFQDCITESDKCIAAAGASPYPALYGLKAYAYYRLGDWTNSKLAFDSYFQKQQPDKLLSGDYQKYADVLVKFPGNESLAGTFIDKAVAMDTTEVGKIKLLKAAGDSAQARKNYKEAADWYNKILGVKKNITKTDLFNAASNYSKAGDIQRSIDIYNIYTQKFPDESFGFYMNARNYVKLDSLDVSGNALNNYVKIVNMTDMIKDKPGEKDRIKNSLRYLIEFYANVKKDKSNALLYCDKGIALDPADSEFVQIRGLVSKMSNTPPPPPKNTPPKPGTQKPGTSGNTPPKQSGTKTPVPKKK